jgi:hypothetical protein
MRTLAEVQKAARNAQVLIDVLVTVGHQLGPDPSDRHAEESATRWFEEMKGTDSRSIESGLLRLTQDLDDDGKGTGWFNLYVQVS